MGSTRKVAPLVMAVMVALAGAGDAFAQACLGIPAQGGAFATAAGVAFPEGARTYSADVQANIPGPFSVGAGYAFTDFEDIDESTNTFSANAAFEAPFPLVSVCPTVGVSYRRFTEQLSLTTVPIGIAVGKRISAGTLSVTPFAAPQFLYMRSRITPADGSDSVTDSTNEFGGVLGLVFGTGQFYANGSVSMTTIDDSNPIFSIGLGFTFP